MDILETQLNMFKPLNRDTFESLTKDKLRPQYNLDGLRIMQLQALRERDLRELYRGRAPYELLQNADDVGAKKAIFILTNDGLAFVHDGTWFSVDNFRSLAEGWSDKNPKECIGHKGLGFRSVLDITPSPHVIKIERNDFFAAKFAYSLNYGHIMETLNRNNSLRADYEKMTSRGQRACPVMSIPGLAKKQSLGIASNIYNQILAGAYGKEITTMFWFPCNDPEIPPKVREELGTMPLLADDGTKTLLLFLESEVAVLLPFLKSITSVQLFVHNQHAGSVSLIGSGNRKEKIQEINVITDIGKKRSSESFFQMKFTFSIPSEKRSLPDTPQAIKALENATSIVSVRLMENRPDYDSKSVFHVYFPTKEETGTGFTLHGDFYVMPQRTGLMPGGYNEWLLEISAKKIANEFLTELLNRYDSKDVFSSMRINDNPQSSAAKYFTECLSRELKKRPAPFIPTRLGMLSPKEVILPHKVDTHGFWEKNFAEIIPNILPEKKAFLDYNVDGDESRAFLRIVDVEVAQPSLILSCIEACADQHDSADWWYKCYEYMITDSAMYRFRSSDFRGRKVIPCSDSIVRTPAGETGTVLCLPPSDNNVPLRVPELYSKIFVFVDQKFSSLLVDGDDDIRAWVTDRLQLARFEASELLPKAIRSIVPAIFNGSVAVTWDSLKETWLFMMEMVGYSRSMISHAFWQDMGRFPVPIHESFYPGQLELKHLCPAFLTYLPDSHIVGSSPLVDVDGLSRISKTFLDDLISQDKWSTDQWVSFFAACGISGDPKLMKFARIIGQDINLEDIQAGLFPELTFSGDWQKDQNTAVLNLLKKENIWQNFDESEIACNHTSKKVLQSVTLVEGLQLSAMKASADFKAGNKSWHERLWCLVKFLPADDELKKDSVYCFGGGGHSINISSFYRQQLKRLGWLPSTHGPIGTDGCYLRQASKRLISLGRSDIEIGDSLLPYVVTDNINDYAKLQQLGVRPLEDPWSAKPDDLMRALTDLGMVLDTDWGKAEILDVKSRWRLVRGGIQEIYTVLNRFDGDLNVPGNLRIAVKVDGQVRFDNIPAYYADPGSSIEKAFQEQLPIVDTDKPHRKFFDNLGIVRLIAGATVKEELIGAEKASHLQNLKEEIVNELAPYALALIRSRSESPRQEERVLRRLQDRFDVMCLGEINVSFSLASSPEIMNELTFPDFYLQRRLEKRSGVIDEFHYTLFVASANSGSIKTIDPDSLGSALAPLFGDGSNEDFASIMPRLTSRYQYFGGDPQKMAEFLHRELNVSPETLDWVQDLASDKDEEAKTGSIQQPPPAQLIYNKNDIDSEVDRSVRIKNKMEPHITHIKDRTEEVLRSIMQPRPISQGGNGRGITQEQQDIGLRGENEIKRRLELPGGWEGFALSADVRSKQCGYDLLCTFGNEEIKVEVKTFTLNGRIFVSKNELRAAAEDPEHYYLIGVLHETMKRPQEWSTYVIHDPLELLLSKGEFDIETELKVLPISLFPNMLKID